MRLVELKKIDADNLDDVLSLAVSDDQTAFVSTVAQSLAQAWVYRDTAFPFAIYADGAPVGFVMLGYYESRDQYTLWKFLIDARYQCRGYGRAALKLAIDRLAETFGAREVYTGVLLGNEVARRLYASVGFVETGLIENNMREMRYDIKTVG